MPSRRVELSPQALADIQADASYIRDELFDPAAARRMVRKIMDRIRSLAHHPLAGPTIHTDSILLQSYRYVLAADHYVFYRVEGAHILIVRIIHTGRDYERLLAEP